MLTGGSWGSSRPMKTCSIFDDVAKLRDEAIDIIINPPVAVDLGIDDDGGKLPRIRE